MALDGLGAGCRLRLLGNQSHLATTGPQPPLGKFRLQTLSCTLLPHFLRTGIYTMPDVSDGLHSPFELDLHLFRQGTTLPDKLLSAGKSPRLDLQENGTNESKQLEKTIL